jgi:membrane protein required for beta-lactamase induction
MSLTSVILALLFDRLLRHWHELRDLSWFEHYSASLDRLLKTGNGVIKFVLVLLAPLLAFVMLQFLLYGEYFNIPYTLFSIIVLLYCLGPDCLISDVEAYIDARRLGDDEEALHLAGALTEEAASTSPDQQTADVIKAILFIPNQRIFTVLFWFVLIGPIGAVLFRLSSNISKQSLGSLSQFADTVQAVLAWLPSRMLASSYALVGNFDGAVLAYKNRPYESDLSISNYDTLVNIGLGALRDTQVEDEIAGIQAARNLVVRGVLCWIAVLALLTLGGWLS